MPTVQFTPNLKRFYPRLGPTRIEGKNVAEILDALEKHYPGLKGYIVDELGALRQHVNIFISDELISDPEGLSDPVRPDDDVYILQALSGG